MRTLASSFHQGTLRTTARTATGRAEREREMDTPVWQCAVHACHSDALPLDAQRSEMSPARVSAWVASLIVVTAV